MGKIRGFEYRNKQAQGFIEVDSDENPGLITQGDILKHADILTSEKSFNLYLDQFGPYKIRYNTNGKRLLISGALGHLASFDWRSKNLLFETQVRDSIKDITWLHDESMLATAQKHNVFIYNVNGVELHKAKNLPGTIHIDFLQHHFLLVASRCLGSLSYLDTSTGTLVSDVKTYQGRAVELAQNKQNGMIMLAHTNGTVTMWSPNQIKPAAKILSHITSLSSIATDFSGNYMATGDTGRCVKIWDLRTFQTLEEFTVSTQPLHLCFSQTGLLAMSFGSAVHIFKNNSTNFEKYMGHHIENKHAINDLEFCPFEDMLGIGHKNGFISIIIPGSGEPNIDSFIPNPYQTKKQRNEYGVKKLLEKIQPEFVSTDPHIISKLGQPLKTQEEIDDENILNLLMPKLPKSKGKRAAKTIKQVNEQIARERKRLVLARQIKQQSST